MLVELSIAHPKLKYLDQEVGKSWRAIRKQNKVGIMVFRSQRDKHLQSTWLNLKFNFSHDLSKGRLKQSRAKFKDRHEIFRGLSTSKESSFYISSLYFWPGTSHKTAWDTVRHLLGHKSHRGMVRTKSIEFLIFEKVGRCLYNPAGEREGHWQLALFILNQIHIWRPLHALEPFLLRWHWRKCWNLQSLDTLFPHIILF